jgi:type I restriction enzyme R subunit
MSRFTESEVEDAALKWLVGLGYEEAHGPEIAAGEPAAERSDPVGPPGLLCFGGR